MYLVMLDKHEGFCHVFPLVSLLYHQYVSGSRETAVVMPLYTAVTPLLISAWLIIAGELDKYFMIIFGKPVKS